MDGNSSPQSANTSQRRPQRLGSLKDSSPPRPFSPPLSSASPASSSPQTQSSGAYGLMNLSDTPPSMLPELPHAADIVAQGRPSRRAKVEGEQKRVQTTLVQEEEASPVEPEKDEKRSSKRSKKSNESEERKEEKPSKEDSAKDRKKQLSLTALASSSSSSSSSASSSSSSSGPASFLHPFFVGAKPAAPASKASKPSANAAPPLPASPAKKKSSKKPSKKSSKASKIIEDDEKEEESDESAVLEESEEQKKQKKPAVDFKGVTDVTKLLNVPAMFLSKDQLKLIADHKQQLKLKEEREKEEKAYRDMVSHTSPMNPSPFFQPRSASSLSSSSSQIGAGDASLSFIFQPIWCKALETPITDLSAIESLSLHTFHVGYSVPSPSVEFTAESEDEEEHPLLYSTLFSLPDLLAAVHSLATRETAVAVVPGASSKSKPPSDFIAKLFQSIKSFLPSSASLTQDWFNSSFQRLIQQSKPSSSSLDNSLWTELYRPISRNDACDNQSIVSTIWTWMEERQTAAEEKQQQSQSSQPSGSSSASSIASFFGSSSSASAASCSSRRKRPLLSDSDDEKDESVKQQPAIQSFSPRRKVVIDLSASDEESDEEQEVLFEEEEEAEEEAEEESGEDGSEGEYDELDFIDDEEEDEDDEDDGDFGSSKKKKTSKGKKAAAAAADKSKKKKKKKKKKKTKKTKQSSSDASNALILCGPVGAGKSAIVAACAHAMNLRILEINASSRRSGKLVLDQVGEATQSGQLTKFSSAPAAPAAAPVAPKAPVPSFFAPKSEKKIQSKPVSSSSSSSSFPSAEGPVIDRGVVVFEDVDIVFEEDAGFIRTLIQLMSTSKRPIIATCNSLPHEFSSLLFNAETTPIAKFCEFSKSSPPHIIARLVLMLAAEGYFHSDSESSVVDAVKELIPLIAWRNADLRGLILDLQFWCQDKPSSSASSSIKSNLFATTQGCPQLMSSLSRCVQSATAPSIPSSISLFTSPATRASDLKLLGHQFAHSLHDEYDLIGSNTWSLLPASLQCSSLLKSPVPFTSPSSSPEQQQLAAFTLDSEGDTPPAVVSAAPSLTPPPPSAPFIDVHALEADPIFKACEAISKLWDLRSACDLPNNLSFHLEESDPYALEMCNDIAACSQLLSLEAYIKSVQSDLRPQADAQPMDAVEAEAAAACGCAYCDGIACKCCEFHCADVLSPTTAPTDTAECDGKCILRMPTIKLASGVRIANTKLHAQHMDTRRWSLLQFSNETKLTLPASVWRSHTIYLMDYISYARTMCTQEELRRLVVQVPDADGGRKRRRAPVFHHELASCMDEEDAKRLARVALKTRQ